MLLQNQLCSIGPGAYSIKLYRSVNYGFVVTAKVYCKFAHKCKNSVNYGKMAVNYEGKSFMEQVPGEGGVGSTVDRDASETHRKTNYV